MKKITFILLVLLTGTAFGQFTVDTKATTTGSAAIIQALLIEKNSDLAFGTLIPQYTAATTWTIYTDGTTPDGTATKFSGSGLQTAATYTITSEPNQSYTINIPASVTLQGPTKTMLVTLDTNLSGATGAVSHSSSTGSFDLVIGGTLDIAANQEPGSYTKDFDVTVAYE